MLRTFYKFQEWLADRVSWVQYPHVRLVMDKPLFFWKYQMPWHQRILLMLFGLFMVIVFGTISIALIMIAFAFFGAEFGWY